MTRCWPKAAFVREQARARALIYVQPCPAPCRLRRTRTACPSFLAREGRQFKRAPSPPGGRGSADAFS